MASHLVDIVIPVFNGATTIRSALGSVRQQTLRDIRILVVDDGSTDATPEILREIAAADRRVAVVTRPNGGIVDARNAGLARCEAEFVAWLDADDLAAPDRIEKQAAYLRSHPDCVAVSGAVRHVDEAGRFLGMISRCGPPEAADPALAPATEPYLVQPFLMARRATLQALGGYRHLIYSEDSDLCWRMQERGRLHNMDDVLGDYRMHADSVSSRSIVNGRIMALRSQLAAISALRRRSGRPDLAFRKEDAARYFAVRSPTEIFALGREGLTADEADHLEIAFAGKLLELTSYRPYELELEDCRFIRSAMRRHAGRLSAGNRVALLRSCSGSAARLMQQGRFREAAALISPAQIPVTAGRLAFRTVASPALRGQVRRSIGRGTSVMLK